MMEGSTNDDTKKVLGNQGEAYGLPWFRMLKSFDDSEARETGGIEDIFRPLSNGESTGNKVISDEIHIREYSTEVDELGRESRENKHSRKRLKRVREAELHKMSERRRRYKIREKIRTLQELIPNSHKPDKASVLDDAVKYLKSLKLQVEEASAVMPHVRLHPRFQTYENPFISSFVPMRPSPRMEMVQMDNSRGGLPIVSLPPGYIHPSLLAAGGFLVPAGRHLPIPRVQVPFMTSQMLPPPRATPCFPPPFAAGFSTVSNLPNQGDSGSPATPTRSKKT